MYVLCLYFISEGEDTEKADKKDELWRGLLLNKL